MMKYSQSVTTPSYLCDIDDRLHPWAAVRLCQEVTEYHGNATGIGFKTLMQAHRAWVITQAFYNVYRLPEAFEKINLATWARGNNGLVAYRDYSITSEDGSLLLAGTSCWPLIDTQTRKVVRLGNVVENYDVCAEQATQYDRLPKLVMPVMDEEIPAMQRTARYAMLDHTWHVNNSEYVRMIFDYLNEVGFSSREPFSIEIGYSHESQFHDVLSLYHCKQEDVHYIKITNPRGTSVTAKITLISAL